MGHITWTWTPTSLASFKHSLNYRNNMPKKATDDLPTGLKFDKSKPDWSLLPMKGFEPVIRVLTYGAAKYERDNWKYVENGETRYLAAALRHLAAYQSGESKDEETGESHLAHAICCLVFMLANK
jgi:hypothetical protein